MPSFSLQIAVAIDDPPRILPGRHDHPSTSRGELLNPLVPSLLSLAPWSVVTASIRAAVHGAAMEPMVQRPPRLSSASIVFARFCRSFRCAWLSWGWPEPPYRRFAAVVASSEAMACSPVTLYIGAGLTHHQIGTGRPRSNHTGWIITGSPWTRRPQPQSRVSQSTEPRGAPIQSQHATRQPVSTQGQHPVKPRTGLH